MGDTVIGKDKWEALAARMTALGLREHELVEKFVLGGGPGGQKVNKTASCVFLSHAASGIEVKCQRSRSREMNRFLARREMCDRLEMRVKGEASRRQQEYERIRRQKRRRSRRQKAVMLADKRCHAVKKSRRAPVRDAGE